MKNLKIGEIVLPDEKVMVYEMKRAKTVWLTISVVVISSVLFGYLYFGQSKNEQVKEGCKQDCVMTEPKQAIVESEVAFPGVGKLGQDVTAEKSVTQNENIETRGDAKLNQSNAKLAEQYTSKKSYDDNWCDAKLELNESDYQFAKNEYDDWLVTIGKAEAGSPRNSPLAERAFPNSNLIEPYESLPLEQLQDLAFQGDKWAMVTFVQNLKASNEAKKQIAKKLMVNGAFYYALEYLVLNSMLEAQTSARKKDGAATKRYVTDALAYAYWGLQYYDIGGIQSFNSVALSERNRARMPIDSILAESVDEVNEKLAKLNQWVNEQRAAQGIDIPTPSKSVLKFFELAVAASESTASKEFELLRGLNITNSNRIASTPCVESILADIKAKSQ